MGEALTSLGYKKTPHRVETPGEWRLFGDRLTLWIPGQSHPQQLDLFGESLESAPTLPLLIPDLTTGTPLKAEDLADWGDWILFRPGEEEPEPEFPPQFETFRIDGRAHQGELLRVTKPGWSPANEEEEDLWVAHLEGEKILPIRCGKGRDWEVPLSVAEHWEAWGIWLLPPPSEGERRRRLFSLGELSVGDLVVHKDHGLAKYEGLTTAFLEGMPREFLRLVFKDKGEVIVPVWAMPRIQRYIGPRTETDSLAGKRWSRRLHRAREASLAYAQQLYSLYQERGSLDGVSWKADRALERAFGDSFPHALTSDQQIAVRDILDDLERPRPMDRVLGGDVGFGKTEVALRAAFRVLHNGGQVALLAPTTVLVRQHAERAGMRLDQMGVPCFTLSRLIPPRERESYIQRLEQGETAMVVGTHQLLGKSVTLPQLGLLIVDEEQRFGVRDKERIPLSHRGIDLLTLSATPIPRTLFSSLSGLRDLSALGVPPPGRRAVETIVERWNGAHVGDVIASELERGGSVFFLHNRIRTLEARAEWLKERFDSVITIHGQMSPRHLEDRLLSFLDTPQSILLTTSLIQNGMDLAGVDTIVVEDAHRFGLGELHQLRGRIGRRQVKGIALFSLPKEGKLSKSAQKRLHSLTKHSRLGSGFALAKADLEMRGAGEILGTSQSGEAWKVGLEFFGELLSDAVAGVQGEPTTDIRSFHLPVMGSLPDEIEGGERLALYSRLFEEGDPDDLGQIRASWSREGLISRGSDEILLGALVHRTARDLPLSGARYRSGCLEVLPKFGEPTELPKGWRVGKRGWLLTQIDLDARTMLDALDRLAPSLCLEARRGQD